MSKSKKNIVDPDDIIKIFGSDAVRWFILSDSPPDRDIQWSDNGIQGAYKYIQKIWKVSEKILNYQNVNENFDQNFLVKYDILIKEISECVEKFQMNVAVAKLYTFLNLINDEVEKLGIEKNSLTEVFKKYLIIISAFIPYIANECWEKITKKTDLSIQEWPKFDNESLRKDEFNIVVQINTPYSNMFNFTIIRIFKRTYCFFSHIIEFYVY